MTMATEPKKRSITGKLVENKLTERSDDYTFNTTYVQSRSIGDLCSLAGKRFGDKYSPAEILGIYEMLFSVSLDELCSGCIVEFGFVNNSLGVEGAFIGPKAQFDPAKNRVVLRTTPTAAVREELADISVIVSHVEEGLPTIITVTDVASGLVNQKLTPGGGLTGKGSRCKIVGEEGDDNVGFFFVNAKDNKETPVPVTSLIRNEPANFSFVIPALEDGTYYLEVATRYVGNSSHHLKEPRRNRFPYPLTVGQGDSESPEEI